MKKILFTVTLIIYSTFGFSQFIRHYEINGNNQHLHFNCIVPSGQGFIIAGSVSNNDYSFNSIYVLRVNSAGTIQNNWAISLDDYTASLVVPRAVWHSIFTNEVVIAGHINNPDNNADHTQAFILSYDLTLSELNWINIIPENSSFLDMELDNESNFLVCGQIDDGVQTDFNACVFQVDHGTGALSLIYNEKIDHVTTNTYFALTKPNTSEEFGLAGRFETQDDIDNHNRRATFTLGTTTGTINNINYYLAPTGAKARFYNNDIQRRNTKYWSILMGDSELTENLFDELFILRTDKNGNIELLRQLDLPGNFDGNIHSLKIYEPGGHAIPSLIAYGSTDDDDDMDLDRAMLISLSLSGNVNWANAFDNIRSDNPSCANSMIISGTNIFAVGWFNTGDKEEGALLRFPVDGGTFINAESGLECEDDLEFTPIDKAFTDFEEPTHTIYLPDPDESASNPLTFITTSTVECFNNARLAEFPVIEKVLTQQFAEQVMISVQNMEADAEYSIFVYDMLGNLITHQQIINSITISQQLSSGMYFYVLNKNNQKILADNFFVN